MERLHILGKVYSGVTNGPKYGNVNESSRSARSAHPMRRGLGGVSWPEWELRSVIFFLFLVSLLQFSEGKWTLVDTRVFPLINATLKKLISVFEGSTLVV